MYMGDETASTLFGTSVSQMDALIDGFELNSRELLDKAKTMLK